MNNKEINDLITEVQNRKDHSIEILFMKMNKPIFALAISMLGDKSLADDVVQETFIRVKTKSNMYLQGTNGVSWMLQIARNLCLNILRKRKYEVNIFSELTDENLAISLNSNNANKDFDISIERFVLKEALRKLNEKERQIVLLYAVSGLKHYEIADLLNISHSTERWYYMLALRKLKKILSK